ncbi:acyltransferase family protein [Psychromicrobium lacuslunae]|uniref:Acyltransferase n=1 Tax=Psychromicrobium lacuslunae TaxID=1618207 RepID=A0A0D4BY79_9MICC|nr:acyltransferase family protein [Psychromicrobium lacuslunae]AJT41422.1 acyltransferase [Psychromicrobium lacuslunae]
MSELKSGVLKQGSQSSPKSAVRKDIQGLRAIAVGLVVLNHLWPERLPGGYVGVDVFFVISGYLISNHLLKELEGTGKIRLGQFYARRAKRLLPASLLVATLSLVAAWVFLPFSRWLGVLQETIASSLYVENWFLAAKSVDYSARDEAASTVQHYWSLSVEEQFYLIWPLLLIGLFAVAIMLRRHKRSVTRIGILLVTIAALIFCIWITATNKSQAYFVTPARAWEFGAGALVALGLPGLLKKLSQTHRGLLLTGCQWLGYAAIVYSAFFFNEETFFPGFWALVPVLGTVLVIASGPGSVRASIGGVLEWRPFQVLGDISYSLYLWHWPLIIIAPAVLGHDLNFWNKLLILVLGILLAYLSKRFVEDPGRIKLFRGSKAWKPLLATAAAMAAVCALCGSMFYFYQGAQQAEAAAVQSFSQQACYGAGSLNPKNRCPDPFGPAKVSNMGPSETPWFNAPECKGDVNPIRLNGTAYLADCDFTQGRKATATVWLIGDSHAEQWKAAFYQLARQQSWQVKESMLGGCPFVGLKRVGFLGKPGFDPAGSARCINWSNQVSERITQEKPDKVFVSAFGSQETVDDGTGRSQQDQYATEVTKRFQAWTAAGPEIFVLRDTPLTLGEVSPDCVALNLNTPLNCSSSRSDALAVDPVAAAASSMNNPKVKVLDLSDQFCDAERCYAVIGGLQVFYGKDHVARSYMKSLTAVLEERFKQAQSDKP